MAIAVVLPALSPTMKEGKITRWLKKEGDSVTSGTAIAECETDKSNLEVEVYDDGVLIQIVVPEGAMATVGAPIAYLGKAGEKAPAAAAAAPAPGVAAPAPPAPAVAAPAQVAAAPAAEGRLRASPLARKIAEDKGLDLRSVAGSGPNGRIIKRDLEGAVAAAPTRPAPPRAALGVRPPPTEAPLTQMQRVIAQRMTEVKPGVPHFYLTVEIEMDAALKIRDEAKALDAKVSVNDVIVKAAGAALRRFPKINRSFGGDRILQLHSCDVGVAVALDDGLITPIVRDADQKGLEEISAEVRDFVERARRKALKPEEYTGGSLTVSNLGMYGISEFTAVINAPQAAILAVGAVTPKPVVREGQVVVRAMMSLTLSGDHRAIDGATGAEYLRELKALLEHPLRLLL